MIGTLLNDRYRIDAELGRGGMGVVYRAHDTVLDRAVAVKVLNDSGLGSEGRSRLLREAQSAAKLNHANIVAVYDAGQVEDTPFIVMELIEGQTLRQYHPTSLDETLLIIRQLCAALEHAHGKGIVHRDIKPENVVILTPSPSPSKGEQSATLTPSPSPSKGEGNVSVKLMDFGLAHTTGASRLTQEGAVVGTMAYIAPEIIQGLPATPQSDLYELGVMWYELVAGRVPFEGDSVMNVLLRHLYEPPLPPSNHNPAISPALDVLLLKLLSKSPQERHSFAQEVIQAIEQIDQPTASGSLPVVEVSPLDRLARGRLVGRERELSEALNLWQQAKSGEGQVLLISGEPGIGKTRLMRELAARVDLSGGQVFSGECYAEGSAPYTPIAQIIQSALEPQLPITNSQSLISNPTGTLRSLPSSILADLITLAPALRPRFPDVPPNPPLDAQAEQQRIFESVTAFIAMLSEQAPVLLIVDDAHWADSGTLSLLRHLARRAVKTLHATSLRLMIVLTYREVGLDEAKALVEVLHDLTREHLATRLKLIRFDHAQTRDLLTTIFAEEITAEFLNGIYQETEGNPFFVEEICKALVDSGKLYFAEGRWHRPRMSELELPQSVRVAIQSRVSKLPETTQETLRFAAILGREFEFDVLQAVGDLDEDALLDALEQAERAQIINEVRGTGRSKGSERFAFAHALIPATLVESVSGMRRRRLHRRAAQALERAHANRLDEIAPQLGRHYAEAEDAEKASDYLLKTGDQAYAVFAYPEAIDAYQQALTFLKEQDKHERAARTLMKLGLIYHATFDFQRSRQAYQEGFALWQRAGEAQSTVLPPAPHAFRTNWSDVVTLDPAMASEITSSLTIDQLFSGLVELNAELEIVPDVARSWEMLDNGQKYIFHLRNDVHWSDGALVTAKDFESAWKRVLNPATHSPNADLLCDIKGAQAFHAGEVLTPDQVGVRAIDAHTLIVELEGPTGYFLYLLALSATYPVPQHVVEAHGADWTKVENIVTNGPFRLEAWQPDQSMSLSHNPDYRGRFSGNVQRVELSFSVDSPTRLKMYEADQLDTCNPAPAEMDRARRRHVGEYVSGPMPETAYLGFDLSRPPFNDPRVRQAFAHVVDRETLAEVGMRGFVSPATGGFVPLGMPGHSPGIGLPLDLERARRLLAEAGYPEGRGFPVVTALTPRNSPLATALASSGTDPILQYLQTQWRESLRIEIVWESIEWATYFNRLREALPHLFCVGWVADYPDPDNFLRVALAQYCPLAWNETYTRLIEIARRVTDQTKRMKLYQEADKILIEEAAIMPLAYGKFSGLVKPWVSRFPVSPFKWFFFKDVVIEPH
jgi:oligopeptide transport system substrate-binding protein